MKMNLGALPKQILQDSTLEEKGNGASAANPAINKVGMEMLMA